MPCEDTRPTQQMIAAGVDRFFDDHPNECPCSREELEETLADVWRVMTRIGDTEKLIADTIPEGDELRDFRIHIVGG